MKLMRNSVALCLGALAVAAFATGAQAQVTSAQQNAIKSNCRSDFMSKCSGVTPGGKEALACLQKNVATLSPACKTAVTATLPPPAPAAAAAPAAPPPAAPAAPTASTAASAPVRSAPPPKAKVTPAPRRAAIVSPAAAAPAAPAAAPTAAQQNAMKQNCRNDFTAHCRGVQPGGKEALGCLQKNVGALSAACKSVVSATMGSAPAAAATPAAVTTTAPEPRAPKAPLVNAAVMLRACKLDLIRHCRGVQPGGGRELACLAAHEDNLTVRCKMARRVTSPLR